jgi:hypothetical protein
MGLPIFLIAIWLSYLVLRATDPQRAREPACS